MLLTALFVSAASANAILPPRAEAPIGDHLVEVNVQWRTMDPIALMATGTVSFASEAERIATHLRMVRERLVLRTPDGLSPSQRAHRSALLDELGRYADGRLFPQNHVLGYRNPVFMDAAGTACAVGHLIIKSGHRVLAQRISREMNLGYVLDMPFPELAAWAEEHGFTAQELAWVQPGYPPNLPWAALGGGTNGTVTVLKTLANGDLLVCGEFSVAGGLSMNKVAVWDGNTYLPLGNGVTGTVECAAEYNGELYLGGSLLDGASDLAKWDGIAWSYSTVFSGKLPTIHALHVHNGELYAAGEIVGFAGIDDAVQRMAPTGWEVVGEIFDSTVRSLASHDGMLVAGGAFRGPDGPTDPEYKYVAVFNGNEWLQLGDGLDATVRTLIDVNGTLYAGGDLYTNIVVTFGMARIATGATSFELLLPDHANYIYGGLGPTWIGSLLEREGAIYAGGDFYFETSLIGFYSYNLIRFNGTPDDVSAMIGFLNGPVNAIAMHGHDLVIGGEFDAPFPHVASLDLTVGIATIANEAQVVIAPNPATDRIWVRSNSDAARSVTINDIGGKLVMAPIALRSTSTPIDVSALAAGTYTITIIGPEGRQVERFVKQK